MSNFKNTVYSILNEDAGDTDQEIRRKANTAALINKGLKGQELVAAIMKYDASKKRSDVEVSAAADNRGREEAVGMVASGEATSMGDARNRMGVRDQVAAERARMAKNPVREVGIASPSSQIGGAGTQYGNSPNRAPETEAEIKYRTGTSAPMADNDPITGKPILFSARDKRNQVQKQVEAQGPYGKEEDTTPPLLRNPNVPFNGTDIPQPMQNDTTPGSEPGGWEGEDQGMADLHNTPAWQKMFAAGQNKDTQTNMQASAARLEAGREKAFKLRQDLRQAQIDNPIDTEVTFTRGSNGKGRQKSVPTSSYDQRRQQVLKRQQAEDSARTGYYPDVKPNSSGSNFDTGTTEVDVSATSGSIFDPAPPSNISIAVGRQGQTSQSGISTSAGGVTRERDTFPIPVPVFSNDVPDFAKETGNVNRYSGTKKLPSGKLPGTMTDGYSHNKALTFFAEQLKRKYIEEEVVNPENQPMSKSEISHRDKIKHKDPAKNARVVKGPRGRLDTSEEAKYRLATYITMRGRKGKKKENK